MPEWVADKQRRLAKIRAAKAALEAEAKAASGTPRRDDGGGEGGAPTARRRPGRRPKPGPEVPADKAQRNFTDPDSRVLLTKDGFIQGYNAQAAVDAAHQIILAHGLSNSMSDQGQLVPMVEAIAAVAGATPAELSADAGYCSEANLEALDARGISGYIATGRHKHGNAAAVGPRTTPRRSGHGQLPSPCPAA